MTTSVFDRSAVELVLAAMGDSQSDFSAGFGVRPSRTWPGVLQDLIRAQGTVAMCRAFGISGDTTTQMLARADVLGMHSSLPDIAILNGAVNDPGNGISQAATQANVQAMLKAWKHNAYGPGAGMNGGITVADQTTLPATGKLGQRYVVLADSSASGGVAAWHSSHAATITGAGGSAQTVWEFRYPLAGERGWGRVATAATAPTGISKILVMSPNYLNFTTGGDTPSTPYTNYANVRTALQAAVTAENVVVGGVSSVIYGDLYTFERNRVLAGTDPNFSADTSLVASVAYDQTRSWHYTQNNQHHNDYGQMLVAEVAILALAAAGWV